MKSMAIMCFILLFFRRIYGSNIKLSNITLKSRFARVSKRIS